MIETTRLNLHCHSHLSDGELPPDVVAERLAAAGVRAAALTDHDTIDGLRAFRDVLSRKGVGFIPGVEMTVASPIGGEIHLLGYGFDQDHPGLRAILQRINEARRIGRRHSPAGTADSLWPPAERPEKTTPPPPSALPTADSAIRAIHEAGGLAFWAHPVHPDQLYAPEVVGEMVKRLKNDGLDGIESYTSGYSSDISRELVSLADFHGLLVSAGSDFHGPALPGSAELFVDFPTPRWQALRDALLRNGLGASHAASSRETKPRRRLPGLRRRAYLLRILLPTLLAIGLFIFVLFGIMIPDYESRLLERKRDMIRELTNVAFSILSEYDADARAGRMTIADAQRTAAERIQNLRYGNEGKDYYWITDLHPRMVMHPYRTDLNGGDVSDFRDPRGVRIFVEFVNALKVRDDAYVEYVWQWKDDPDRLVPKQSFIKKFAPWGWIVGTGLYLEDVRAETAAVASRLIKISIAVIVLCGLLLLFVVVQSVRSERKKRKAEAELRESHEKYRTLVESVTEGTLMVLEGRPTFANPTLLDMLEFSQDELALLDLEDLFVGDSALQAMEQGVGSSGFLETEMRNRSGGRIKVALAISRISFAGKDGFVLAARDLSRGGGDGGRSARREFERENLIGELQASLMFLHEPIAPNVREAVFCDWRETVSKAAAAMTARGSSAAVVLTDTQPVGIVTDQDIRARIVAGGLSTDRPVFEIMSSPLVAIGERALVFEAILAMREKNVDHLLVRDEAGLVAGILQHRDLLLFQRYSLAVLTQSIRQARTVEQIVAARQDLPKLVKALIDGGAKARNVTRAVTAVSDAVVEKLIDFGQAALGPPPARFAFLALGSQGREEQTLATDQDHAVVFENVSEEARPGVQDYFQKLGEIVSGGMEKAGFPLCLGKIMADNPRWCQPLRAWMGYFEDWLRTAEPQDILDIQIFFDFRTVVGEKDFALELRRHIDRILNQEPPFLLHYARASLQYKSPLGFLGHVVLGSTKDGARTFNIKDALLPVVNFARLYALRHGVQEMNTLDRLHALFEIGTLKRALHDEAVQVYDYLMQLRISAQARAADRGLAPGNEIDPKELTHLEETLLKQALTQIANIQKKISFDFLGSA